MSHGYVFLFVLSFCMYIFPRISLQTYVFFMYKSFYTLCLRMFFYGHVPSCVYLLCIWLFVYMLLLVCSLCTCFFIYISILCKYLLFVQVGSCEYCSWYVSLRVYNTQGIGFLFIYNTSFCKYEYALTGVDFTIYVSI